MRRHFPAHHTVGEIHASAQHTVSTASETSIVEKSRARGKATAIATSRKKNQRPNSTPTHIASQIHRRSGSCDGSAINSAPAQTLRVKIIPENPAGLQTRYVTAMRR